MPAAFTHFLCGLDFAVGPAAEVLIAGRKENPDTQAMFAALKRHYAPGKVVIFLPDGEERTDIETLAPWTQAYASRAGRATAYVCAHFSCSLPTADPQEMIRLIEAGPTG